MNTRTARSIVAKSVLSSRLIPVALLVVATMTLSTPAQAALGSSPPKNNTPLTPHYYLALGASVSLGVEPTPLHPSGTPTRHGYATLLNQHLYPASTLLKLGCPGESTTQMISGHDPCNSSHLSQLSLATSFLLSHPKDPILVTIDMGFNDIAPCLRHQRTSQLCLDSALSHLSSTLPNIIAILKAASSNEVSFVGLNHYNPYAAYRASNPSYSLSASLAVSRLNAVLASVYSSAGVPVADIAAAFAGSDSDLVSAFPLDSYHAAKLSCHLTWMCRHDLSPNIHPTNKGYAIIATTIYSTLTANYPKSPLFYHRHRQRGLQPTKTKNK